MPTVEQGSGTLRQPSFAADGPCPALVKGSASLLTALAVGMFCSDLQVENFYNQCDPGKENLCLYGYADGSYEVALPCEEVGEFVLKRGVELWKPCQDHLDARCPAPHAGTRCQTAVALRRRCPPSCPSLRWGSTSQGEVFVKAYGCLARRPRLRMFHPVPSLHAALSRPCEPPRASQGRHEAQRVALPGGGTLRQLADVDSLLQCCQARCRGQVRGCCLTCSACLGQI